MMAGIGLAFAGLAHAQADDEQVCGSLRSHYGPFDFRRTTPYSRQIVENAHFTRGVETLTRGKTGAFGGDINYTLRVYPNHPRALLAMERLVEKEKKDPPYGAEFTVECYYERALRYQPDDHLVRMLAVAYLTKQGKTEEARRHLDYVVQMTPEDPSAQYLAGVLYMDMKAYDKALEQAHKAMAMGMQRTDLRERLAAAGHWVDPPATAASAASAAASSP